MICLDRIWTDFLLLVGPIFAYCFCISFSQAFVIVDGGYSVISRSSTTATTTSTGIVKPLSTTFRSLSLSLRATSDGLVAATTAGAAPEHSTKMASAVSSSVFQAITGIREVADRYDCFLIDMWGVMHDGKQCYDGVIECIQHLKSDGKELIILSNSSKRKDSCYKMLTKLGLDPVRDFTHIITSGEVAYHLLRYLSTRDGETDIVDISDDSSSSSLWVPKGIPTPLLKRSASTLKVFCFGSGDEDEDYLTSCGWDLANSMDDADLIVARGPFTILTAQGQISRPEPGQDSDESETTYQAAMDDALQVAARRCVPMVVANPDKVRPDADKSPMPGTIGMAYEEALVRVHPSMTSADVAELIFYVGKPFEDVYEIALRGRDLSRACMVGDALETDITGASTVGIDSIWVIQDGIHNDEVEKKGNGSMKDGCHSVLTDFNALGGTYAKGRHLQPTFIAPHFQW